MDAAITLTQWASMVRAVTSPMSMLELKCTRWQRHILCFRPCYLSCRFSCGYRQRECTSIGPFQRTAGIQCQVTHKLSPLYYDVIEQVSIKHLMTLNLRTLLSLLVLVHRSKASHRRQLSVWSRATTTFQITWYPRKRCSRHCQLLLRSRERILTQRVWRLQKMCFQRRWVKKDCYEHFNQTLTQRAIAGSVQTSTSQVSNLEGKYNEKIARVSDSVTDMQAELRKLRNIREAIDRLYLLTKNEGWSSYNLSLASRWWKVAWRCTISYCAEV